MGIDCSGLAQEFLRSVGMDPEGDQSAKGLWRIFRNNIVDQAAPGCLIFYGGSPESASHVAICLNEHLMIEAGGGGSSTTTPDQAHRQKAFVRMRPIDRRRDILGIVDPFR